jgi:protein-S-isoprenylcysteine O-methyltransferase Ste14
MALINELEKQGNFLFRYRGQFPVLLFFLAIPFLYWTELELLNESTRARFTFIAILISFLGFCVRAYTVGTTPKGTSGRNTKEQKAYVLNTTGIYATVRHPLYVGNFLMWMGIVLFTYNLYFVILVSLLYWLYYERIMFAEERFLERKFGDEYIKWASSLPAFFPNLKSYTPSIVPFSFKTVLRREYSGLLATVIGFAFVELIRNYFFEGSWFIAKPFQYALMIAIVLAISLRSLKHYTHLLAEENRS